METNKTTTANTCAICLLTCFNIVFLSFQIILIVLLLQKFHKTFYQPAPRADNAFFITSHPSHYFQRPLYFLYLSAASVFAVIFASHTQLPLFAQTCTINCIISYLYISNNCRILI